ncbi:MAG: hypothetical protein ABIS86_02860, partial [Streptosporangiaceae bacterium]
MKFSRRRVPIVLFGTALAAAAVIPGAVPSAVAATNLVANPGFEKGTTCWTTFKAGGGSAKFTWARGSHGKKAFQATVRGGGNAERAAVQTPKCAVKAKPGKRFSLGVTYKNTGKAAFVLFRKDSAKGWVRWDTSPYIPVSRTFRKVTYRTNVVPEGTTAIRWGISQFGAGTLVTDDYRAYNGPNTGQGTCTDGTGCAKGRWAVRSINTPERAIHSVLLRNGKVLLIAGSGSNAANFKAFNKGTFKTYVFDPVKNTFKKVYTPVDLFCAGHVQLSDGKVLVVGGTLTYPTYDQKQAEIPNTGFRGLNASYLFNPSTNRYEKITSKMKDGHWYASATQLGNGDVFAAGGNSATLSKEISPDVEYYSAKQKKWLRPAQSP